MRVRYTLESLAGCPDIIYLAGPTYRVDDNGYAPPSYRNDIIDKLDELDFNGTVVVPEFRDNNIPDGWSYYEQIKWEMDAMSQASRIIFWIPRDLEELPAFTTNIEFGEYLYSGKILAGAPSDAPKNDYLAERLTSEGGSWYQSISGICHDAVQFFKEPPTLFFTADTHFSQERTFTLSKRPFSSVYEMDNTMISRWNRVVRSKDTVYHLGDIGEFSILDRLNFGHLKVVEGNYERDDRGRERIPHGLSDIVHSDYVDYTRGNLVITIGSGDNLELIHEPVNRRSTCFGLFGHVHMNMVKDNMVNVGTDLHNFSPIDIDTVLFYMNAVQNHYDENVFMK